jgi:hypothetical protein
MYQVQGQSWIVMGDPVGPRAEWPELIWADPRRWRTPRRADCCCLQI